MKTRRRWVVSWWTVRPGADHSDFDWDRDLIENESPHTTREAAVAEAVRRAPESFHGAAQTQEQVLDRDEYTGQPEWASVGAFEEVQA